MMRALLDLDLFEHEPRDRWLEALDHVEREISDLRASLAELIRTHFKIDGSLA
jgi:hypothetical protein